MRNNVKSNVFQTMFLLQDSVRNLKGTIICGPESEMVLIQYESN